jgi:polyhydroxybutyrate depolymerase
MRALLILLTLLATPAFAQAPSERHEVPDGYYRAAPPPDWDGSSKLALIVYFHGWNASPEGTFRNRAMVNAAHRRGALFVSPYARTGYWRQIGAGRAEGGRDEKAYIEAVMADIRARWPIDESRTVAAGFSRGASMVWNVACYAGHLFAGYAPIAGGFWGRTPDDCPSGPVNLRHIHGLADGVVAFDERGIYNSAPVTEGLGLYRRINGCAAPAQSGDDHPKLRCEIQRDCASDRAIELCLHDRGHSIPAEWVAEGLDWLDRLRG